MRGNRLILAACESSAADFAQWMQHHANEELHPIIRWQRSKVCAWSQSYSRITQHAGIEQRKSSAHCELETGAFTVKSAGNHA